MLAWLFFIIYVSVAAPISFNPYSAFQTSFEALWNDFWDFNQNAWSDSNCGTYVAPVVWNSAVASLSAVSTNNKWLADQVATDLLKYKYSNGGFSSAINGGTDMYQDDISQVIWVFIKAYKLTGNEDYLQTAKDAVNELQTQWDSTSGGVKWKYNEYYIASISTLESALASVLLYEVTQDSNYLDFSKKCANWTLSTLQDPSDKLFYDGLNSQTKVLNKGKLSYTAGVAISTFSKLYKIDSDNYWLERASELVSSTTAGTGALYNSYGYWNNQLKYLYLLFQGIADYVQVAGDSSPASQAKTEAVKQATYIYEYLQDGTSGTYYDNVTDAPSSVYTKFSKNFEVKNTNTPSMCSSSSNYRKSLLTNSAASLVFFNLWRI